jgi:hypothetical protein
MITNPSKPTLVGFILTTGDPSDKVRAGLEPAPTCSGPVVRRAQPSELSGMLNIPPHLFSFLMQTSL